MGAQRFSDVYVQYLSAGPFPGRVDPWSEVGHYFQQIHAGMISNLISQMNPQLLKMGYLIGREASLQIVDGRELDIFVQRALDAVQPAMRWNYELAAAELLAAAGVTLEDEIDLQAIHIKHGETGRLVTVVEIISPNNKTKPQLIADYRLRREHLLLERGVNVVEIDATRSVKHLVNASETADYAYHIVVYLPGESPYFIGIEFGQSLIRLALPLRGEALPLELQAAYTHAYQQVSIAAQILNNGGYQEDDLPFPSLLTVAQRHDVLEAVQVWRDRLEQLRKED